MLTIIFITEATFVLSIRKMDQSLFTSVKSASWFVWLMVLFIPILHVIAMYIPQTQILLVEYVGITLDLIPLTWWDWVICMSAGLTPILTLELYKRSVRRKGDVF